MTIIDKFHSTLYILYIMLLSLSLTPPTPSIPPTSRTVPVVWFAQSQLMVGEGDGPLSVVIMSDSRVSDNVLELVTEDGTATGETLVFCVACTYKRFPYFRGVYI